MLGEARRGTCRDACKSSWGDLEDLNWTGKHSSRMHTDRAVTRMCSN